MTIRGRRPIIVTEDNEIFTSPKIESNEELLNTESQIANIRLNFSACQKDKTTYGWMEAGNYQLLCQSELPRLIRNVKVLGMSIAVCNETLLSIITSDTKIQVNDLKSF